MKIVIKHLVPICYELEQVSDPEFIVYSPSDRIGGSLGDLKNLPGITEYWRDSRCLTIDFKGLLEAAGFNYSDLSQECSYTLSYEAFRGLRWDIQRNFPEVTIVEPDSQSYCRDAKITVYEYTNKTDGTSVMLVEPPMVSMEVEVLPCKVIKETEIEVEDDSALHYYTSDSQYTWKNEDYEELCLGFPGLFEEKPEGILGKEILKWSYVIKDDPVERPWRTKLEALRNDIGKVLEGKDCIYLKGKKINRLLKQYYGNYK